MTFFEFICGIIGLSLFLAFGIVMAVHEYIYSRCAYPGCNRGKDNGGMTASIFCTRHRH
jgi:hypothetical protein